MPRRRDNLSCFWCKTTQETQQQQNWYSPSNIEIKPLFSLYFKITLRLASYQFKYDCVQNVTFRKPLESAKNYMPCTNGFPDYKLGENEEQMEYTASLLYFLIWLKAEFLLE